MPRKSWIAAVTWLLLRAGCCFAAGQPGEHFNVRTWSTREGLPASSVIAMVQTRDGYLWLGTRYGLVRFDGLHFSTFDRQDAGGLNSATITQLFEDSHGNLWAGTKAAGIRVIKDGKIIAVPPEADRFQGGALKSVCEDAAGVVWLYTEGGQMIRYQDGRAWAAAAGANIPSVCRSIIAEKSGVIWRGTDSGLFSSGATPAWNLKELPNQREAGVKSVNFLLASRLGGFWCLADGRVQKWSGGRLEQDLGPYPWKPGFAINAACEDHQGNLIAGIGGDGAWWFDAEGHATQISERQGLSHATVLSLCLDREGSLWVGTDGGGLDRVKRQAFEVAPDTLGKNIQSVSADRDGGVVYGQFYGGINSLKDGVVTPVPFDQLTAGFYTGSVFVDDERMLWAGMEVVTTDGRVVPFLAQRLTNGTVRVAGARDINGLASVIYQDHGKRLWIGGERGTLGCWDGHEWKSFTAAGGFGPVAVTGLADGADGALWIATDGDGLKCLKDGRFTAFHEKDGLPDEHVFGLCLDDAGVLWAGTKGGGLGRYQGGKWTAFTTRDGLATDIIDYLLEDGLGYLWIGSNKGLMRIKKAALNDLAEGRTNAVSSRAYQEPDGMPASECSDSQPAACRTPDGRLWFATIRGLVSVDPAQLGQNTNPPPVVIESVMVDGHPVNADGIRARLPDKITISAGSEHLDIQYTSLNLAAADKSRFRYRLDGLETNWIATDNRRIAPYSKLPPREYRFEVTACNEDNVWNETPASLTIIVLPPFWRQWWFISAVALGLLGIIVGVVHYISTQKLNRQLAGMRQQQALEQERARIARDIHDQLGASLTQVSLLGEMVESDKDSPGDVADHAQQISKTARDTARALDEIVWTVNPSNDTLDGLVNYICKYAQEYLAVAGLRYRLDVPAELPAAVISPEVRHNAFLAAKEAVTNVVRHARATSVFIRLRLEPAAFTLEIQDDGKGVADVEALKASSRNGLRNMSKRMEDIGGRFEMSAAPEGGTIVRLTVPIKKT